MRWRQSPAKATLVDPWGEGQRVLISRGFGSAESKIEPSTADHRFEPLSDREILDGSFGWLVGPPFAKTSR